MMRLLGRCAPLGVLVACGTEEPQPASAVLSATELVFGEVAIGAEGPLTLSISNPGDDPLTLFSVSLDRGDSSVFRVERPGSSEISAGGTVDVLVTFTPEDLGEATGRLQLRTSDEANPSLLVDLSGVGTPSEEDADGDGFSGAQGDCNDSRDDVYPGAPELCDGRDNDCSGSVPANEADADRDGYRLCDDDCDDDDDDVYPGAVEICDGKDNDCDNVVPDELDRDNDGFSICDDDCDDDEANAAPGLPELCDGIDNNCDGGIDDLDADSDGHTTCFVVPDCDDNDASVFPVVVDASAAAGGDGSEAAPLRTLAEGLAALDATCRTVYLAPGRYEESNTVASSVILVGAGAESTELTAAEGSRPLRVTGGAVALQDLAMVDASHPEDGAALRISGGSVSASGVVFSNNSSTGGDGGAVAVSSGADFSAVDSSFSGNSASDDGGAVAITGGDLSLTRVLFDGNSAADGGAVYADADAVIARDLAVQSNSAAGDGGGLYLTGGSVDVARLTAYDNTATGNGGGLYIGDASGEVRNGLFRGNSAATGGGLSAGGTVELANHTFVGNDSTGHGAALSLNGGAPTVLSAVGYANTGLSGCSAADALADDLVTYSTFFLTTGGADYNGSCLADATENDSLNPVFLSLDTDDAYDDDDLSPGSASPLRNSGPPSSSYDDRDGSQNDRGHTGGPDAP